MRYTFQPMRKRPWVRGHLNLGGANPQGGRIDVNNLYLERDGKPWSPLWESSTSPAAPGSTGTGSCAR